MAAMQSRNRIALLVAALVVGLLGPCVGPASAVTITPDYPTLTQDQKDLVDAVIAKWLEKLNDKPGNVTITISFEDLSGRFQAMPDAEFAWPLDPLHRTSGPLGLADNFVEDPTTRKPLSARVRINSKFVWWEGIDLPPGGAWPDPAAYDLYTIMKHEIGHAIGFTTAYSKFAAHVTENKDGSRTYNAGGSPTATLTPAADGTHTDPTAHPGDIMNPTFAPNARVDGKTVAASLLLHSVWDHYKDIPTISEWGLILTGAAFVIGGPMILRRMLAAA